MSYWLFLHKNQLVKQPINQGDVIYNEIRYSRFAKRWQKYTF